MSRIIVFAGKGGTGKTAAAAAHARLSALGGQKTLLAGAGAAHSLGGMLGRPVGKTQTPVADNLYAVELDGAALLRREYPQLTQTLRGFLLSPEVQDAALQDIATLPGLESLFALLELRAIWGEGAYARVMLDCASSGEILSLLKMLELLGGYLHRMYPVAKKTLGLLGVFSPSTPGQPPAPRVLEELRRLYADVMAVQALLQDGRTTTVRLVCLPEKIVVEETKRSYMYLNLYGYSVDGLYVNRVLPRLADNPFFESRRRIQDKYLAEIEKSFFGLPTAAIPWYAEELRGLDMLDRTGRDALGAPDLFAVRSHPQAPRFTREGAGYRLQLPLPGVSATPPCVALCRTDLEIETGETTLCVPLPGSLRGCALAGSALVGETLNIHFHLPGQGGDGQ